MAALMGSIGRTITAALLNTARASNIAFIESDLPWIEQKEGSMPQHNEPRICSKLSILVFDVNETLIDIESMNPLFERVFGDKRVMREWFGHLIMYSMTVALSGLYKDFWTLGAGLFQMIGAIHDVNIKSEDVEALKNAMKDNAGSSGLRGGIDDA